VFKFNDERSAKPEIWDGMVPDNPWEPNERETTTAGFWFPSQVIPVQEHLLAIFVSQFQEEEMDWIFVEEMKEHKASSSSVRECAEGREPEKARRSRGKKCIKASWPHRQQTADQHWAASSGRQGAVESEKRKSRKWVKYSRNLLNREGKEEQRRRRRKKKIVQCFSA
jgi:hypothetical protein